MDIEHTHTTTDYQMALKETEGLMTATLDAPEGKKPDELATLINDQEREHYLMKCPPYSD